MISTLFVLLKITELWPDDEKKLWEFTTDLTHRFNSAAFQILINFGTSFKLGIRRLYGRIMKISVR